MCILLTADNDSRKLCLVVAIIVTVLVLIIVAVTLGLVLTKSGEYLSKMHFYKSLRTLLVFKHYGYQDTVGNWRPDSQWSTFILLTICYLTVPLFLHYGWRLASWLPVDYQFHLQKFVTVWIQAVKKNPCSTALYPFSQKKNKKQKNIHFLNKHQPLARL